MKKLLSILLAVVLVGCTFAACGKKEDTKTLTDLEYIKEKGTLVIGMTDYAPMNYKDDNGEWTGFDTEFAQLVGKKLGVEVKFVELVDWDEKYTELNSKSVDAIWNGMTITDEGKLNASISNPYIHNAQVVVMAKDKLASYPDAESMKSLKFAVENGSAGASAATDCGFTNVTIMGNQSDALLEVASGSVDACIIDITMAKSMTGEGTSYANFSYSFELTSEEYGIAFRKTSDATAEVNKIMAELIEDGTLVALAEKYGLNLIK